mgnify:CR=1 FL=1
MTVTVYVREHMNINDLNTKCFPMMNPKSFEVNWPTSMRTRPTQTHCMS